MKRREFLTKAWLNNIRRFHTIQRALEKRDFTADQIEKIVGGNWVRVLTESLGYAISTSTDHLYFVNFD